MPRPVAEYRDPILGIGTGPEFIHRGKKTFGCIGNSSSSSSADSGLDVRRMGKRMNIPCHVDPLSRKLPEKRHFQELRIVKDPPKAPLYQTLDRVNEFVRLGKVSEAIETLQKARKEGVFCVNEKLPPARRQQQECRAELYWRCASNAIIRNPMRCLQTV